MTSSLIARHEVKDFDAWMEMFNDGAEIKQKLGAIAQSVHRDLDYPNRVTVYHQCADAATARAFVDALNRDRFRRPATESGNTLLETLVARVMADVD